MAVPVDLFTRRTGKRCRRRRSVIGFSVFGERWGAGAERAVSCAQAIRSMQKPTIKQAAGRS